MSPARTAKLTAWITAGSGTSGNVLKSSPVHSLRIELRDHVPRDEDEEPDLLELPDHRRRGHGVRRLPDQYGDPGDGAVHKVDPEFAKGRMGTKPIAGGGKGFPFSWESAPITSRGQERGRTGVEGVSSRAPYLTSVPARSSTPRVRHGRYREIGRPKATGSS